MPMKALIVDDVSFDRTILRDYLEHKGYEVMEAENGKEGLELAVANKPDLIISDILMPVMDGFQFLINLRKVETDRPVTFIFYSAIYTEKDEQELALASGADAFIVKPKDQGDFLEELSAILKKVERGIRVTGKAPIETENEGFWLSYGSIVARKLEEKVKEVEKEREIIAASEKRYRNLFSSMWDVVIVSDLKFQIVDVNQPAMMELLGYETEELRGRQATVLFADERSCEELNEELQKKGKDGDGRRITVETNLTRKNGEIFPGEICCFKLKDDKGTSTGYLGVIRDITERKQWEKKIQLMQSLTQSIAESPDFNSAIKNTLQKICLATSWAYSDAWVPSSDGSHLECSPVWYSQIGDVREFRAASEKIKCPNGESLIGRVQTSKKPEWIRDVTNDRSFLRASIAREVGIKGAMAIPIIARDEVVMVIAFYVLEDRKKDADLLKLISAIALQLGSLFLHKRSEEALQESEERFRQLAENIREVFWIMDWKNDKIQILYVSSAYEDIWGRSCESLYLSPASWVDAIHEDDRPRVSEAFFSILSTGSFNEEYRIVHTDGTIRFIHDKGVLVKDGAGELYRVVGIAEDITEHRKLEEGLRHAQKMAAVGQLAGGVAHEFNNILTAMVGFASLLQGKIGEEQPMRDYVDKILELTQRQATLTRNMLALSRTQENHPHLTNLNDSIEGMRKFLSKAIGEDIELRITIEDKDLQIMADPLQFEQALLNLVTNARDSMPGGGVLTIETSTIELDKDFIKTHGYGDPGEFAVISVSDTGAGMNEETSKRIFEPFFTTKEVGKGTGLGLSMVYGIIKQHKGFINVYSEPGVGSTFRIYLPLTKGEPAKVEVAETPVFTGRGRETILVAENDPSVRKLVKMLLEEYGYTVISAVDGDDAVKKFSENRERIQLLLLDMIMQKKNGKEAFEEITKTAPGFKVIFMSGYPKGVIDSYKIMDSGMHYISKPVRPMDLLKNIREVLDS